MRKGVSSMTVWVSGRCNGVNFGNPDTSDGSLCVLCHLIGLCKLKAQNKDEGDVL